VISLFAIGIIGN